MNKKLGRAERDMEKNCTVCDPRADKIAEQNREPLFAQRAKATFKRCVDTFDQRGDQYGDTWRNCQFLALKSVAKQLGIDLKEEHCKAMALATLVDVKYIRLLGGYQDDSMIDGINYSAALAEEMQELSKDQLDRTLY